MIDEATDGENRMAARSSRTIGRNEHDGVVKADRKDDKFLAGALASHASYIVTVGRHLPGMQHWRSIAIVTRLQFAGVLDEAKAP